MPTQPQLTLADPGEFRPQPPNVQTVSGQIVDHEGKPVAGIQVAFLRPGPPGHGTGVYCRTTTDENGHYSADVDVAPGDPLLGGGTGHDDVTLWLSGVDGNSGCPVSIKQVWVGKGLPAEYDVRLPRLTFARIVVKSDEPNTVLAGLELCVSGDGVDNDPAGLLPPRRWTFGTTAKTDVHGLVIAVVPVGKFRIGYRGDSIMDGCSVHESPRRAPSRVALQGSAEPLSQPPTTWFMMSNIESENSENKPQYAFEFESRTGAVCDVTMEVSRADLERLAGTGW